MRLSLHRKVPTAHASYYSLADLGMGQNLVPLVNIKIAGIDGCSFP